MSKIYCIITASLYKSPKGEIRKNEYIRAITKLLNKCNGRDIHMIIVENNGLYSSFLDDFDVDVNYTDTNKMDTTNYGIKELHDVLNCIERYEIGEEDYVIKITGRYCVRDDSPFFSEIFKLHNTGYEAVLKYGSFNNDKRHKHEDCVTGLICMKTKYIKQIEIPTDTKTAAEWRWAKPTMGIDDSKICALDRLGIMVSPSSANGAVFEV